MRISIPADRAVLTGELEVPPQASGVVMFAHGSGSGWRSPRNRAVANRLRAAGLATVLFDLLTPAEGQDRRNVFDIGLLAARLTSATQWTLARPALTDLRVGYFGASTGAAAALVAAAKARAIAGSPYRVEAVVCRGGRPDLAGEWLRSVDAATLLVVGGRDTAVLGLNEEARTLLGGDSELVVVAGATHLFEEPGALEKVAGLATRWFVRHLGNVQGT